jgi:mycofactocin system FadH/OYE family oxidoreductase 2
MQQKLFQPIRIGPREASNRIIFGSHTTNYARHNLLSEKHAQYYEARAEGGAGMIVLEEHIVHSSDQPYERALLGYLPETSNAIASVVERIHAHNALVLVQLNHNGQQSSSDYRQRELWAPSAVPDVASREVPKVMELSDIQAVIEGFALVSSYSKLAGADGVELQVSDRSLLRQFLSPLTNQRGDQYGGALENRLRFVQETIEAVDAAIGDGMILGMRFCADELAPWAGITPEQGREIAELLTATKRIDYLTITMGSIFSTQMFPFHASMHMPPGYSVYLSAAIKAAVDVPVFAAGRIMTAAQAETILAEEQADGIEMIRTLIADPAMPNLSREGHADDVRPCLACNQGCQVRTVMNVEMGCNVNPDVLRIAPVLHDPMPLRIHDSSQIVVGATPHKHEPHPIVVIGGGPAGMEAARTAAQHGKRVVLYEREEALGGTVTLAAKGPGRGDLKLISAYLQKQIAKLGVEIHLGIEVTAEMILADKPEAVIIATGAHTGYGLLPIPGHELSHVMDVRRILHGERLEGQRVVILDETDSHGVMSVAELLAIEGRSVEIVTEDWYVGRDLVATHDIVSWMQRTMALGVVMTTHTTVSRIEPGQVIVTDRFAAGERAIPADIVVPGTYDRPSQELYFALKGHIPRLLRAGDCVAPRRIEQAIAEGRLAGEQC